MRQALELALEALKENVHELIAENKALKESLRQPEQEPDKYVMDIECTKCGAKQSGVLTVNTTPPQRTWAGLTDDERKDLCRSWSSPMDAIYATEAKLKEKNTQQDTNCKYCTNGCAACDARKVTNVLP